MTVVLNGRSLTLEDVVRVARGSERVAIDPEALAVMEASRRVVERALERGDLVYGASVGVGVNRTVRLHEEEILGFSDRLVREHAVGQGPPASHDVVRACTLRLANGLVSGVQGVRPRVAERLVEALNQDQLPRVRLLGSLGLADLAPLADLAIGVFDGWHLEAGEGLALIDNNAFSTAQSALALWDAIRLQRTLEVVAGMSLEAFAANLQLLHQAVGTTRPYPGLIESLNRMRTLLAGSSLWEPDRARNLHDPVSFRSLPHVLGALRDALGFGVDRIQIELNASQGNPIVVHDEDRLVSVANFDVAPLAQALDLVRVALASAVTGSCERALKLLDSAWSGLPTGLVGEPGSASLGMGMLGVASQAIAVEARLLAQPVSHELASTSEAEGIEDRATNASLGARRLAEQVALGSRVAAIELVVALRGIELRRLPSVGSGTAVALQLIRRRIPGLFPLVSPPDDIEEVVALICSGDLADVAPIPPPVPP